MHRREFLSAMAGFVSLPVFPALASGKDVHVAIIGAGAAGIAAGRYLTRHGYKVLLLEARKRIGGRAWASDNPFGVAFDYGCPQLDDVNVNPFAREARRARVKFEDWVEEPSWYVNGRRSDKNDDAMDTAMEELIEAIDEAGARQVDTPVSRLSVRRSIADAFSLDVLGPVTYGLEAEELSAKLLYNRMEGAGKARPENGTIGGLLQKFSQNLPVRLDARVNRIIQTGEGVRLSGSFGTIRAHAAIVTVPPVLLARDEIDFDPPLDPVRKKALNQVKTGHIERCALSFEPGDLRELEGKPLYLWRDRGPAVRLDLTTRGDTPMAVMTYGGDLAASMAKEDLREPLSLLRHHLSDLFGSKIRRRGEQAVVTRWAGDLESLGAVQMPGIGSHSWSEVMHQPLGKSIYFAGDAWDEDWPGRIGGAWNSGRRVGKAVRQLFKQRHAENAKKSKG